MPVHKVKNGYQWGNHGHVYKTRAEAEKQARAIYAAGYRGDGAKVRPVDLAKRRKALRANKRAEDVYASAVRGILRGVHQGYMKALEPHLADVATAGKQRQDAHHGASEVFRLLGVKLITHVQKKTGEAFDAMAGKVDRTNRDANRGLVAILPDARTSGVIAQFRDQNIKLVENAARVYADQVRSVFDDPNNFNLRVEDLAAKLQERGDVSESRANLIARDQTLKLNGQLSMTRQTNAGIREYVWSTSQDERVRPMHADLNGQVFSWDSPPETNEAGDTNHPGQDFQCRCIPVAVIPGINGPEDDEG